MMLFDGRSGMMLCDGRSEVMLLLAGVE